MSYTNKTDSIILINPKTAHVIKGPTNSLQLFVFDQKIMKEIISNVQK